MEKNHEQSIMADDEKIEEYAKSYEAEPGILSSRLTRKLGEKDLKIEKLQSQLDGARAQFKRERNSLVLKETQTHNENVALKSKITEVLEANQNLASSVIPMEKEIAELKDCSYDEYCALIAEYPTENKLVKEWEDLKNECGFIAEESDKLKDELSCMVDKERLSFRLGYGSLTEQFDWEKSVIAMRKDLEANRRDVEDLEKLREAVRKELDVEPDPTQETIIKSIKELKKEIEELKFKIECGLMSDLRLKRELKQSKNHRDHRLHNKQKKEIAELKKAMDDVPFCDGYSPRVFIEKLKKEIEELKKT